jgi:hypothetical protein
MIVSDLIGEACNKGLDTSNESVDEDVNKDDEIQSRQPHMKDRNEVSDWLSTIEQDLDGAGAQMDQNHTLEDVYDMRLPQLSDYEEFIKSSESYRWLLCKLRQNQRLCFGEHNAMDEIGSRIRKEIRAQESLRKMSIRRPLSNVQVDFVLQWHPRLQIKDHENQHIPSNVLENTLCLTGSWCEAQAMTVKDYMLQTWPITGEVILCLFENLLCLPKDYTNTSKNFSVLYDHWITRP